MDIDCDIKSKLYENVYRIFSKCSQLSLYYTLGDDFDIDWISIDFHKSKCQISALVKWFINKISVVPSIPLKVSH